MLGRNSENKFQNDVAGAMRTGRRDCSASAAGARARLRRGGRRAWGLAWEPQGSAAPGGRHDALCVQLTFAFYSVTH